MVCCFPLAYLLIDNKHLGKRKKIGISERAEYLSLLVNVKRKGEMSFWFESRNAKTKWSRLIWALNNSIFQRSLFKELSVIFIFVVSDSLLLPLNGTFWNYLSDTV